MNHEIIRTIEAAVGTPFYVYDERCIIRQIQKAKDALQGLDNRIMYCLKANGNPELLRLIDKHGLGMEVATPGEFSYNVKAGIPPSDMLWNSNGKTLEQISFFIGQGIRAVNIDSIEEMELWGNQQAKGSCISAMRFFLRINPCIDPVTHPYLSTGLISSKFGIQEHLIPSATQKAKELHIPLVGFHTHIGSQITDSKPLIEAYSRMFALSWEYGFREINLGGGWGVSYDQESLNLSEISKTLLDKGHGFKITMELGRFITCEAGNYIAKVVSVKWSGSKHFVVVDGGMNHLIRPALYGAVHPYELVGDTGEYCENFDIVGPLCESGDILVQNACGILPKAGSLVCIKYAGAYGYSMANNYNGTVRPPEILIDGHGQVKTIRERELI